MEKLININFNTKIDSGTKLEKMVSEAYQKNKDFFGKDLTEIKINFLYQRSQMDEICKYKTGDWQVGYAENKNIFIFSPFVFEKVSNHPNSDFPYTLIHEIAHLFSNEILGFAYPKWFNEGLAGYVAEQYKIRPVKKIDEFSNLHDKQDWKKFANYPQAFAFTKYLIGKFGKEKILEFLKNLRKNIGSNNSYDEFVKFFNNFLKTDFDEEVSLWSKSL